MTHTPAPAEIETLRKIVAGRTCTEHDQRAAVAILDRLSPPEPEQPDEATVWTRKIWGAEDDGAYDRDTVFQETRAVIAELIASKDGERDALYGDMANRVAALRAENEPPEGYTAVRVAAKDLHVDMGGLSVDYRDGWYIVENKRLKVCMEAAERNPADPDILSVRAERALGQIPAPDTAPVVDETTQRMAARMGAKFVKHERWPERNPAGPGPWPGDPDHRETMPVGTAPVVEVTQADRDAAGALVGSIGLSYSADMIREGKSDDHEYVKAFARHRTEAEARGRREALTDIELIPQRVKAMIGANDEQSNIALGYCEAELRSFKRLMTEGK